MAWKKDLEKLKQALGAEDTAPRKPAPPPKPKPVETKSIEEEDAVFLSAMGHRPRPAAPSKPAEPAAPPPPPPAPEAPAQEFSQAMADMKGMVPLRPTGAVAPARPASPAPAPPPPAAAKPVPPPPPAPATPPAKPPVPAGSEPVAPRPVQINLAAGMAIDVDGALDLRGHGRGDAEERLKERILDSHALGWRTLHVVLGPAEDLRAMLLDLLQSPSGAHIARYAQAPIPMGGSQAWILYFRPAGEGA